jgi:hypothetical protein
MNLDTRGTRLRSTLTDNNGSLIIRDLEENAMGPGFVRLQSAEMQIRIYDSNRVACSRVAWLREQ